MTDKGQPIEFLDESSHFTKDELEFIKSYVTRILKTLFDQGHLKSVDLTDAWFDSFDEGVPGVYLFFEKDETDSFKYCPVYVGETDDIRRRMRELKDTRNHVIRRNIGEYHFSSQKDYTSASSMKGFPDGFETKVEKILKELKVSFVPVYFGRKEIERCLLNSKKHCLKYNKNK